MSSDDTVLIRVHPAGGYALTMMFGDQDQILPTFTRGDKQQRYGVLRRAWDAAWELQPEYGVRIHPDCWSAEEDRIIEEHKKEQREVRKVMRLVDLSKSRHPSNGGK